MGGGERSLLAPATAHSGVYLERLKLVEDRVFSEESFMRSVLGRRAGKLELKNYRQTFIPDFVEKG